MVFFLQNLLLEYRRKRKRARVLVSCLRRREVMTTVTEEKWAGEEASWLVIDSHSTVTRPAFVELANSLFSFSQEISRAKWLAASTTS